MSKHRTTPYSRGRAFEHRVSHALEERGWYVIRAAGSKGLFDLVAWPRWDLYPKHWQQQVLIQCRVNGECNQEDRDRMRAAARNFTSCVYIVRRDGATLQARIVTQKELYDWRAFEEVF